MKIGKLKLFEDREAYEAFKASFAGTLVACIESEDNAVVYGKTAYRQHNYLDLCLWDSVKKKLIFVSYNEYSNNNKYYEVLYEDDSVSASTPGEVSTRDTEEGGAKADPTGNTSTSFIQSYLNADSHMLRYTPIAICVIPSGVLSNDYGTFMLFADYDYMTSCSWQDNISSTEVYDQENDEYHYEYEWEASGLTPRTDITPIINPADQTETIEINSIDLNDDQRFIMPSDIQFDIECNLNTNLYYPGSNEMWDPEEEKNLYDAGMLPIPPIILEDGSLNENFFNLNTSSSSILIDKDGLANTQYLMRKQNASDYQAAYHSYLTINEIESSNFFPIYSSSSSNSSSGNDDNSSIVKSKISYIPSYIQKWYLPSIVELMIVMTYSNQLNVALSNILDDLYDIYDSINNQSGGGGIKEKESKSMSVNYMIWSSTEYNDRSALVLDSYNQGMWSIWASDKYGSNSGMVTPFCRIPCIMDEDNLSSSSSSSSSLPGKPIAVTPIGDGEASKGGLKKN